MGFFKASCNDDPHSKNSIQSIRELIGQTIANDERLEHVRNTIPQGWLRVKNEVTDLSNTDSILTYAQFQAICEQGEGNETVTDPDEQRALLGLLNDLGTIVAHGLDRNAPAARREITLLEPNWLTEAIYPILEEARSNNPAGEFSRSQLGDWLDPKIYPPERHEFILDMMQDPDLGLAARLPATEDDPRYLVPRALPSNAPNYDMWPHDFIRFRYRYEILPGNVFPRFIVEAHRELADPPTRWQTGAILKVEDCLILVKADLGKRIIDIMVDGSAGRGRAALGIVRLRLENVHERNPEINAKARAPLPDQPEIDVSYDHLIRLEDLRGPNHKYLPEGAEREYEICELLEGVRMDSKLFSRETMLEDRRLGFIADRGASITIVEGGVHNQDTGISQIGAEPTAQINATPPPVANSPENLNSGIWTENKKWVISTVIAIASVIVAIVALK